MKNLFLYARKSTDVEDKQILSIDRQIHELREFAEREQVSIIAELIEKESAKLPGRPVFNDMLSRLEAGEADGILAWHPDRLARNSVDGGRIIYMLDTGVIKTLKFPTFRFEPDPQGKFMLNIMFGQSKYYVDSLSENTKSGLREEKKQSAQSAAQVMAGKRAEIERINLRLQRLLDSFLDAVIERNDYTAEKAKLMSQKKTLEEQIAALSAGRADWLEPFQKWILTAKNAGRIAESGSLQEKRVLALEIFGSNLVLDAKKARGSCVKPWSALVKFNQTGGMVRAAGFEPATPTV